MKAIDYTRYSVKNLARQKFRTFLTVLAIMIGSLSIVLLIALSEGIKQAINLQLASIGALTTINIPNPLFAEFQGGKTADYKLDNKLVSRLETIDHVESVSPTYLLSNFKYFTVEGSKKNIHSSLLTVRPNTAGNKSIQSGREFKSDDTQKVILGGSYIQRIGQSETAESVVGKSIILTITSFDTGKDQLIKAEIIGVTKSGPDDAQIYITENWAGDLIGKSRLANLGYDRIALKVDKAENVGPITDKLKEDNILAIGSKELLAQFFSIFSIISYILGTIGAISLLVASIGIINTMTMATYERTREIGILRSIGASKGVIKKLFLFESATIGLLGGIAGISLAILVGGIGNNIISRMLEQQSLATGRIILFPTWLIIGTLVFTTVIGVISGIYPAIRAAKLKPVDALRYE
jgi:putative ABC transport system permease protein